MTEDGSTDEERLIRLAARFLRHAQARRDAVPAVITDLLRAHDLGRRHMSVLIGLAVHGPLAVGALAARIALAPASTSQLVGELRRAGLVTRSVDARDRRRAVIDVAGELRAPLAEVAAERARPFRMTLDRLSAAERAAFLRGWRLLVEMHDQESAASTQKKGRMT
ncbi:MAG TPA: MarR family transcriptional regulator [Streptosporangiaceae bacterium]